MGRRRDGGTGPGGTLGSAPDGTEVEVRTHLLPRDYDILGSESDMDRRIRAFFPLRLMRVGAPRPRLALADQPTRTLGAQVRPRRANRFHKGDPWLSLTSQIMVWRSFRFLQRN
jgi:hypothetical protein